MVRSYVTPQTDANVSTTDHTATPVALTHYYNADAIEGVIARFLRLGPEGRRNDIGLGRDRSELIMSGAAILPVTSASCRHKKFTSWDAFELPYPFTRVTVSYGEPVIVPPDADGDTIENKRLEVETNLIAVTRKIDEQYHG